MNILTLEKSALLLIGNCPKPIKGHEKGDVVRGSCEKLGHTLHYLKGDISISVFERASSVATLSAKLSFLLVLVKT